MLITTNLRGTARPIVKLPQLHLLIQKHMDIAKARYFDTEHFTGGPLEFIIDLLKWVKDDAVLHKDMLDVLINYVSDNVIILNHKFDTITSGVKPKRNCFFKGLTEEILIPTSGILGSQATALDTWEVWKNVQPIKIVDHDSPELRVYWSHQINFLKHKPTYAVISVDVEALLMKYFVYLREAGYTYLHDNQDIHVFVNEEIIPFFYRDLVDIWMCKVLKSLTGTTSLDLVSEDFELVSVDFKIDSMYKSTLDELTEFYKDFLRGKYRIGDLLRTKFFLDNRSLFNLISAYETEYANDVSRRYIGYTLTKMADVFGFIMCALNDTRDRGLETMLIRRILYQARLYNQAAWETHVKNKVIRERALKLLLEMDALS